MLEKIFLLMCLLMSCVFLGCFGDAENPLEPETTHTMEQIASELENDIFDTKIVVIRAKVASVKPESVKQDELELETNNPKFTFTVFAPRGEYEVRRTYTLKIKIGTTSRSYSIQNLITHTVTRVSSVSATGEVIE